MMTAAESMQIRQCGICKTPSLRVIAMRTVNGDPMEVARCMRCDTAECPRCKGRTIEVDQLKCKHCGHSLKVGEPS